jgi:hypothetical protein
MGPRDGQVTSSGASSNVGITKGATDPLSRETPMTFLTLLAIAVGIISAAGLMVVGLVEAPWQVLLLGLLAALYGLQRQVWASDLVAQANRPADPVLASPAVEATLSTAPVVPSAEPTRADGSAEGSPKGDELTYRGIQYRPHQSAPETATQGAAKAEGVYRGQRWQR